MSSPQQDDQHIGLMHEQLMHAWRFRDAWRTELLSGRNSLPSIPESKQDVTWLYQTSHLRPPSKMITLESWNALSELQSWTVHSKSGTFIMDSRMMNHVPGYLVKSTIDSGAWSRIFDEHQVRSGIFLRHINGRSIDLVREIILHRLSNEFARVLSALPNSESIVPSSFGMLQDGPSLAFLDYLSQSHMLDRPEFERYRDFITQGIYALICYQDLAIICAAPKETHYDERYRPHSMSHCALKWHDGTESYYLHGVPFEHKLWDKIAHRTLSAREAISLANIEQRTIAIQTLGYETMLKELQAKVVDREKVKRVPSSRVLRYEVLEADLNDDRGRKARFVKVQCPSTGKETLLRVTPFTRNTRTVRGAIAWTFGMRPEAYNPMLET